MVDFGANLYISDIVFVSFWNGPGMRVDYRVKTGLFGGRRSGDLELRLFDGNSYLYWRFVSQGKAATYVRCGRQCYMRSVTNFTVFTLAKNICKSVKILRSYGGVFERNFRLWRGAWCQRAQLTELKERCAKLENQCKAKHAAGERSKALNNFNDKYSSVSESGQRSNMVTLSQSWTWIGSIHGLDRNGWDDCDHAC